MESAGTFYHVLNRDNYRQEVFTFSLLGEQFEWMPFKACGRFGWRLHAYVLMSNHRLSEPIHLGAASRVSRLLHNQRSQAWKRRHVWKRLSKCR